MRIVGGRPCRFSTWSPKVIALIGSLADTLTDRSIVIPLRRKRVDEMVERTAELSQDSHLWQRMSAAAQRRSQTYGRQSFIEHLRQAVPVLLQ